MSFRSAISLLLFVGRGCLSADGDDRPIKLPDDGWWIRYLWFEKTEIRFEVREYTEKLTFSFVGTVTENAEKCRWVEVHRVYSLRDKKERITTYKLLVSEKDLLESENPLEGLKRGWVRYGERDVNEAVIGKGIRSESQLLRIFPGVWRKSERLNKERIVDYQKGRLTISDALTRTDKTTSAFNMDDTDHNKIEESTVWFDRATSPVFTVARFQIKSEPPRFTKDIEMVVEDFGNDAQSKLLDNN